MAALYESWSIPFSVMLVVPLGVSGGPYWQRPCGLEKRRLLPGGLAHHHRVVGQERDTYRRVCQGAVRDKGMGLGGSRG
ncbi:hypothetical protein ACLK2B_18585 [Escherichia coli]